MHTHTDRTSVLLTGSMTLFLAVVFVLGTRGVEAVECVGKPYGYPGCPTRPAASSSASSGPNQCGNAILDPGEDCDKGRFNGRIDCSTECRTLYCGDGIITKDAGEECEPQSEERYVQDKSGNLTTQVVFIGNPNQCGWFCQPPVCNDAGKCSGGCKLKYISECSATGTGSAVTVGSSSAAHAAAPAVPASSAAAPALQSPVCGNNVVEKAEECDDGNKNNLDGCSNVCSLPLCGDGFVQEDEECDDGNTEDDDSCTNDCLEPVCGDGIRQEDEQCDDGPKNSDTTPNACRTSCEIPACGDGVVDKGEQCDVDGQNSDTVANACRTTCKLPFCGDKVKDGAEECDDGNQNDTDTCTTTCKLPVCGDGIVRAGEECDWGAKNSDSDSNACRKTCRLPRCGDKVVDAGEQCDAVKDCSKDCKVALDAETVDSDPTTPAVRKPTVKRPAAPVVAGPTAASRKASAIFMLSLAVFFTLSGASLFVFRRRLKGLFSRGKKGGKDLDDIPLDQIEMPWHKW